MTSCISRWRLIRGSLLLVVLGIGSFPVAGRAADDGNPLARQAAPFAGTFADGRLTLNLAEAGSGYVGTITLGDQKFPATATASGQELSGSFTSGANSFRFTAMLAGTKLTLVSSNTTYSLTKSNANPLDTGGAAPENPLARAAAGSPPTGDARAGNSSAGGAGAVESVGGFSVLGSTDTGKTLFIKLPGVSALEAGITRTADELAKLFHGKPALSGGFADSRTKLRGGALFTAMLKGRALRGWIFCSLADGGATSSVIYAPADAAQAEVATLFAALPAPLKMQAHAFPDGSGSIDLPPGWTTQTQSLAGPLLIAGPSNQHVTMNAFLQVSTPDGQLMQLARKNYQMKVQNYQQMQAMSQRSGGPPPPAVLAPGSPPDADRDFPQLLFCKYCATPEDMLKFLMPVIAEKAKKAGRPYTTIDRIIESVPADPTPMIRNARAGIVYYAITNTDGRTQTHVRVMSRIETWPVNDGKDSWTCNIMQAVAPDDTFDRDLPVMNDITSSLKVNPEWLKAKAKSDTEALLRRGEEFHRQLMQQSRDFNAQQAEHFNRFESQMKAQSQARHDANSDFIEMIGGVRDVYDNKTGKMLSVDYYHVDGIVNGMNAAANDPSRFVQIPLRYER